MTVVNRCELKFGVLGPLEVCADGRNVEIGSSKRRVVLATLLLNANRTVTLDRLIDAVWPAAPPRSALGNLHTYVSDLRRFMATKDARITTRSSGYSITVRPHELDLLTFDELMSEGARLWAEGRLAEALDLLQQALALWRGEPLEGLMAGPAWEADLGRLAERRQAAHEERLALLVELEKYTAAISEARALLHGQPFREKVWRLLMLALNRSGRRAEALQAYVDVRRRLVEELGVEPGPELRRTHATILADGDASADKPANMSVRAPGILAAVSSLCQLPASIPDFTGRAESVRELTGMLSGGNGTDEGGGNAGQGLITAVIAGPPGVGKSALAVHVAHLVREAFPDGQLYADLGGTTRSPREPGELLAEALRALGVTGAAMPASLGERAALYRTLLADRRVLVVVDNAMSAAQVRPLLPATAGCAVMVTSRHRLAELSGAYPVVLDALGTEEAQELMGRIVGRDRIEREPKEAAAIVSECAYLPLAIRIAGAKLAGRKTWTLKVLRQRLADESRRISELQVGDLGVRTSFAMSMRMLPPDAARAFRLLGMLGAQTFPSWVIDAILDRHHTDDVLDALLDAHMLQPANLDAVGQPRYRLPDLLRAYAREAAADDPPELRRAALTRMLGGWLALADQAANRLLATVDRATPGHAPRWRLHLSVAAPLTKNAHAWFEAERHSLLTGVALAAESGLDELAWELAACLVPYLDLLSLYDDWRRCHEGALSAVRAVGNRRGEVALLRGLGQLDHELSVAAGDRRGTDCAISAPAADGALEASGSSASQPDSPASTEPS